MEKRNKNVLNVNIKLLKEKSYKDLPRVHYL